MSSPSCPFEPNHRPNPPQLYHPPSPNPPLTVSFPPRARNDVVVVGQPNTAFHLHHTVRHGGRLLSWRGSGGPVLPIHNTVRPFASCSVAVCSPRPVLVFAPKKAPKACSKKMVNISPSPKFCSARCGGDTASPQIVSLFAPFNRPKAQSFVGHVTRAKIP